MGTGYIDAVMMMPTAWNIEKQALDVTSKYGLDERVSINDAYQTATVSFSSMLPLVAGIAVIFIAGYLLETPLSMRYSDKGAAAIKQE